MGQYYKICNLDKKEYLSPHACGDGAKLMEFGSSGWGTMRALAILLASGNNRGSGDLRSNDPLIGSWAGDRIVIAGDYDDEGKFIPRKINNIGQGCWLPSSEPVQSGINLYDYAKVEFTDISEKVQSVLREAGEEMT